MNIKYTFSGHESFPCKSLWLKKGYDFVFVARGKTPYVKSTVVYKEMKKQLSLAGVLKEG